jgi:DNA-binding IclR family transcriptional regulator
VKRPEPPLSESTVDVLDSLAELEWATNGDLVAHTGRSRQNVSSILSRCQYTGLVAQAEGRAGRGPHPWWTITEKGRQRLAQQQRSAEVST